MHGEIKKFVVTLLVMRHFFIVLSAPRACVDFCDPTAVSRLKEPFEFGLKNGFFVDKKGGCVFYRCNRLFFCNKKLIQFLNYLLVKVGPYLAMVCPWSFRMRWNSTVLYSRVSIFLDKLLYTKRYHLIF